MKQPITLILALSFSVCAVAAAAGRGVAVAPLLRGDDGDMAAATAVAFARANMPYVGKWSNGRGERLSVTKSTLRFNSDKPVTYRDVTKVTDGNHFSLRVTARGPLNYFTKFIALAIDGEEMKMTLYDSYEDMFGGNNPRGESTWYLDK
jgi:hypothetical protein